MVARLLVLASGLAVAACSASTVVRDGGADGGAAADGAAGDAGGPRDGAADAAVPPADAPPPPTYA
jgi:hypothetical protein